MKSRIIHVAIAVAPSELAVAPSELAVAPSELAVAPSELAVATLLALASLKPFLKVDKVDFSKVDPKVLAHNRSLGLLFSLNLCLQLISVRRNNLVIDNEIIIVLVQSGQNPSQRLVHN